MHAFREHGRTAPRILYWFRTPPSVRVGRAALDEEAIRLIEEANPGLAFDWTRMVNAAPGPDQPAPRPRERDRRRPVAPPQAPPRPASVPASQPVPEPEPELVPEPAVLTAEPPDVPPEPAADWMGYDDARGTEAFEFPDEPGPPLPPPAARHVEDRVGHEGVGRLRARYSELMARIAQRTADPARLEELRTQAERLNPDTWVTDEEARRGIETFEAEWEALRAKLGRRRRRRRGGARRRGRPGPDGGGPAV